MTKDNPYPFGNLPSSYVACQARSNKRPEAVRCNPTRNPLFSRSLVNLHRPRNSNLN
ncbi:hypothetical protein DSO57_1009951 [Entomophthora muscae]|uniref:Uncharacterized protein n=1 Tax=Entomophthora muscae TaxID=34485 RepID=A0ACC2UG99_9FUNG|nr:hypothetical protein DSO57_1009951 [Entomophthora muscae]